MRRAAKRDKSEPGIVEALRASGAQVTILSKPVDLLVRYRGVLYLMECKTPGVRKRKDQQEQEDFCRDWCVPYIRTPTDALREIGATS